MRIICRKETKQVIQYMQMQVQQNPRKGFWLVSTAAFLVAPFLTNDGVCLLFVELILDAFEATKSLSNGNNVADVMSPEQRAKMVRQAVMPLETGDAIYFLLTLACSSNIGSGLTYTGASTSHISYVPLNLSKIILTSHFFFYLTRQSSEYDRSARCNRGASPSQVLRSDVGPVHIGLALE